MTGDELETLAKNLYDRWRETLTPEEQIDNRSWFYAGDRRRATYKELAALVLRYCVINPFIKPDEFSVKLDGDKWCVLLGPDLQRGVAGFATTSGQAMSAFRNALLVEISPTANIIFRQWLEEIGE